jgi:hypothetical protein
VEKVGSDQYVAVFCSVSFLESNGIEIPAKAATAKSEEKPEVKKKK